MTEPGRGPVRTELERLVRTGVPWGRDIAAAGMGGDLAARRAAVLVLFGDEGSVTWPTIKSGAPSTPDALGTLSGSKAPPDGLDLLFVERAASLSHHPGQIAFPGGRVDPEDSGPVAAALREAEEETGLDPDGVDVVGVLGDLPLPVSNHVVTPVLAWWARPTAVGVVDTAESAAVFRVPVAELLAPETRRTAVIRRGTRTLDSPAFVVGPRIIWGFTGIVLDGLFESLGWTQPWERHEIEIPL